MKKFKKVFWRLVGGIGGIIVGGWMIFVSKDNLGFLPLTLGTFLLIFNYGK